MRILLAGLLIVMIPLSAFARHLECKEIQKEIARLEKVKLDVEKLKEENERKLSLIKAERERLERERVRIEQMLNHARDERFKKLARIFEKMDPEVAGGKLSLMDPETAAYIIFNMKDKQAGAVLNFVDDGKLKYIVDVLTKIKLR